MERLTCEAAGAEPLALFSRWLSEAEQAGLVLPNAMHMATVAEDGRPRARMVLFKGLHEGGFVLYTNFRSAKAQELERHPEAALTFWWDPPGRQVRVEGSVRRLDDARSDAYFATRPRSSQVGAHASCQSAVVADRHQLERQFQEAERRFAGRDVPRPEFWGGYVLEPRLIEFWQTVPGRMHDRIRYRRAAGGAWQQERLSP